MDEPNPDVDLRILRPSKTRRKQDSHDLQKLGTALVEMSAERLRKLDLPENLLDALLTYQNTRSHEGRRRQMQYIGKLMRGVDAQPLREAAASERIGPAREALALHQAERWRAELMVDDDALTRFAAEHPNADVQQLRSVIRNARKDAALVPEKRSGRHFRELFQMIRDLAAPARPEAAAPDDPDTAGTRPAQSRAAAIPGEETS
jgi:ribosome-associated protein